MVVATQVATDAAVGRLAVLAAATASATVVSTYRNSSPYHLFGTAGAACGCGTRHGPGGGSLNLSVSGCSGRCSFDCANASSFMTSCLGEAAEAETMVVVEVTPRAEGAAEVLAAVAPADHRSF
jgi:hypothetical protein